MPYILILPWMTSLMHSHFGTHRYDEPLVYAGGPLVNDLYVPIREEVHATTLRMNLRVCMHARLCWYIPAFELYARAARRGVAWRACVLQYKLFFDCVY